MSVRGNIVFWRGGNVVVFLLIALSAKKRRVFLRNSLMAGCFHAIEIVILR